MNGWPRHTVASAVGRSRQWKSRARCLVSRCPRGRPRVPTEVAWPAVPARRPAGRLGQSRPNHRQTARDRQRGIGV